MSNISYQDIPASETVNERRKIHFRRRIGDKSKYIYLHEEDKDYIVHWCKRLVCDVAAKQVIDPYMFDELYKSRQSMPISGYSSKRNSIMTYSAGIVSNIMRNPNEDIAYNQLKYITKLFKIIQFTYSQGPLSKELGYHHITKKKNSAPDSVYFKSV
jgi:hypothetical protein